MEFTELAKKRYSVRKYAQKPIEEDKLKEIIEAGRVAPTARNLQSQKVYVIESKEGLAKIAECSGCTFGAPVVFMFGYDTDIESYDIDTDDHMGSVDADIVQTHMMLAAADLGLGTCWVKLFDAKAARRAFGIPKNIKLTSLMPCGYPAEDAAPSSMHSSIRPLEETVEFL